MKQHLDDNGSLIAANTILLDESSQHENNKQKRINIALFIGLFFALILSMIVYIKWQKVPEKKHYLRAEYISSSDSSKLLRAEFILVIPRLLDLNSDEVNAIYVDNRESFIINSLISDTIFTKPMYNYSRDSLPKYIGSSISKSLSSFCSEEKINLESYSEIFFYAHLDNERKKEIIESNGVKYPTYFSFTQRNHDLLSELNREDSLKLRTKGFGRELPNELINSDFILSEFHNVTTTYFLTPALKTHFSFIDSIPQKRFRKMWKYFEMEDISQANYSIKLRSDNIPELKLKIYFGGSISCFYTINNNIDLIKYKDDNSLVFGPVNIGKDFIELSRIRKNNYGDLTFDARVQFVDMQNAQRIRLFVLTAIITVLFTTWLKLLWTMIFGKPSKKQKKEQEITNNETEDSVPDFYL